MKTSKILRPLIALILCLGFAGPALSGELDFSQWVTFYSPTTKSGIEIDHPSVFTVSDTEENQKGVKIRRVGLHLPCSLASRFTIEILPGQSLDEVVALRFFNDDGRSMTFDKWVDKGDLEPEDITIGGRQAFKVKLSASGQTVIVGEGFLISYDDPQGCTSDPAITDIFEKMITKLRFL